MSGRSSESVTSQSADGASIEEASDGGLTLSQIEDLGRIQVVWQRIQWGKNTMRFNTEEVKAISKVSEKVLKGKAVENSIKLCTPPRMASHSNANKATERAIIKLRKSQ